jgi:hypothetical protein
VIRCHRDLAVSCGGSGARRYVCMYVCKFIDRQINKNYNRINKNNNI